MFSALQQYNLRLNPKKCVFGVDHGKFLIDRLTAISCFLSKLVEQTQPMLQLLKKSARFSWNDECEQVFQNLKNTLTSPPILHKSDTHQPIFIYITATDHTVSIALVQEVDGTIEPCRIPKPDTK